MYAHSLATITLCEDYGISMDRKVGMAAQGAVNYIMRAQNRSTGGWRYKPGEEGDTSVVGWQVMALKSAEMAGIKFDKSAFAGADRWLNTARGSSEGAILPMSRGNRLRPPMSSVGLLCRQYLGTKRTDRLMVEGVRHLMANQPDAAAQNVYYWYYATQVMHNLMDSDLGYVELEDAKKSWSKASAMTRRAAPTAVGIHRGMRGERPAAGS